MSYSVAGTGNRLDANPVDSGENTGSLSITLHSGLGRAQEENTMGVLRQELARIPGVQYEFSRPSLMSFASPIQIEIAGFDLNALDSVNRTILKAMTDSGQFTDIKTTIELGNPETDLLIRTRRSGRDSDVPHSRLPDEVSVRRGQRFQRRNAWAIARTVRGSRTTRYLHNG